MTLVTQRGDEILRRLPPGPVVGAEVGVWDGRLSLYLLSANQMLSLYMVDRWAAVPLGHRYQESGSQMALTTETGFQSVENKARRVVKRFPGRAHPLKGESVDVAEHIADDSLDFVFLDADHSCEAVKEDIAAWYPKLKRGGVLGGHDWDHPDHPEKWGVRQAVEEFAAEKGIAIETGQNRTWFVRC